MTRLINIPPIFRAGLHLGLLHVAGLLLRASGLRAEPGGIGVLQPDPAGARPLRKPNCYRAFDDIAQGLELGIDSFDSAFAPDLFDGAAPEFPDLLPAFGRKP